MKKKTLVPLIIFLLGICLVSLIVYKTDTHEKEQRHITAQLNVATYGERIKNEITNGIEITDTLKQILISEDGEIHQFETIAGNLMSDSIESVQLAPNGVVTDIYPANGNEAGKIDLIHDKDRGKISCYARDNHTIITQGPFKLKQGGYGIAVRNPVYLKDKNGHEYFWGFTIVILRVPDIFSDSISALSNFGYEYKISKTDAPWSDTYKVVYQSDGQINHPVSYTFTIGDENWKFEITPKSGWRNATLLIIIIGMFLTISLLLSVLTRVWLVAKEHKKKFQILARTDSLTNIYNRYGFDEFAEKMPDGYQTMIGENGSALSGGERQRISIARAFLKDAPIILLDEASSSLDVENESLIQASLSKLIQNKTVLIIAHRMRTVAGADRIVVLKDGYVAQNGRPTELAKEDGIYHDMIQAQLQSEQWKI